MTALLDRPARQCWSTAAASSYREYFEFVHDPRNHNTMFNYLCRDTADSLQVTLDFLLKRYTWIGIQELYSLSIKVLFLLFGMRITPSIKEREGAWDTLIVRYAYGDGDQADRERLLREAQERGLHFGTNPDEGAEVGGDYGPYYQSQRQDRYRAAVQALLDEGLAYYDYATKDEE